MVEVQPSSVYRQKAAELRAAAERAFDFSIRYELLVTAEDYDKLADFTEKQNPPPTEH